MGTSLLTQTTRHARVAVVGAEDVAGAGLVPEDVRLVMAKVVAGYGVVPGFRRSVAERIGRDYDPARDWGGARGDVARNLISRNLHVTRAEKRDGDPRERHPAFLDTSWALSGVVLNRVGFHLEAAHGLARESFEEHASAVVVDRVSGEGATVGAADVDAPRAARDAVADDLGVVVGPFRPEDGDARITGTAHVVGEDLGAGRIADEQANPVVFEIILREGRSDGPIDYNRALVPFGDVPDLVVHDIGAARIVPNNDPFGAGRLGVGYDVVLRDGGVDAPTKADRAGAVAYETVSHDGSVAGAGNVDSEGDVLRLLEAPEREAGNANVLHARSGELAVLEVHASEYADALRSEDLRAGRVRLGLRGSLDHGVVPAQLYPILVDHHVLSVDAANDDRVARMGSVYGLLDGLTRPNDRALRSGGADLGDGQGHPACHQHGQSHGGQQHYGASHEQSRLPCKGGGVSSVARLDSRRPFISNARSILAYRGMRITQMGYLWCYLGIACA